MSNFLTFVEKALLTFDLDEKISLVKEITLIDLPPKEGEPRRLTTPGRPERPILVSPRDVPKRGLGSVEGRAALLHALAHIEFNAVNLALDAIYRFRKMPFAYYEDWLKVAKEEALHFTLLRTYLKKKASSTVIFPRITVCGIWRYAQITMS